MTPSPSERKSTKMGRFYGVPTPTGTKDFPSVTNLEGIIAKPALIQWSANVEREACLDAARQAHEASPTSDGATFTALMGGLLGKVKAHRREAAKAAEIGTQAHTRIEWELHRRLGHPVGPEPVCSEKALWAFMAWEDWAASVRLEPILIEQTVWSLTHEYAGTMDLFALVNGVPSVLDWKTGKAVYPEAYLQNVAYRRALREMGHGFPKAGWIIRLPKVDTDPAFEPVNVDEAASKLYSVPDDVEEYLFNVFLHVKEVWWWAYVAEKAYQDRRKAANE